MEKPKIAVVGSSNTDMVIKLDRLPCPGETVIGGDFIMVSGGKGANQAVAAARLGGEITFIARVGKDMFGKQAIRNFNKEGIDTDYIIEDENNPSGAALILVDKKGENSIAVASGANSRLSEKDIDAAKSKITGARVLLLQLETQVETVRCAARLASEAGVKVILNPAPARQLDSELYRSVTILTPNEIEAEILTGIKVENEKSAEHAGQILLKKGAVSVVITLGEKGAFLVTNEQAVMIPAKKIKAVDTTAAGDAFNGALAYALAKEEPLDKAVRFANLAGAFSATKLGAQPSMPAFEELCRFGEI